MDDDKKVINDYDSFIEDYLAQEEILDKLEELKKKFEEEA